MLIISSAGSVEHPPLASAACDFKEHWKQKDRDIPSKSNDIRKRA